MIKWISNFLKSLWSLPVILGTVGVAGLLLISSLVVISAVPLSSNPEPTHELLIIHAPTSTPFVATATATVMPSPTSNLPPTPLPGMIGVGSFVQITGTSGTGLNIRDEAGLSSNVFFLAYDAEAFEVGGGPVSIDGFTWWYLITPVDSNRAGWAAADYLSVIPRP